MPDLGDIFRRYGSEYLKRFSHAMLPGHKKALYDIAKCQTEAAGGGLEKCNKCGYEHFVYYSCHNRSCPRCHRLDIEEWLEKRKAELLPVPYFHLVFTLPSQLHATVRSNQKAMYNALIRAAAYSLKKLSSDPHYLGGKIGILCVLHTWSRLLGYHPHVHCLVPGLAISSDSRHLYTARKDYLVPVKALSIIFRAKFIELVKEALPKQVFPSNAPKKWVVYSKPTMCRVEKVLEYLARYLYRCAITDRRIISDNGGKIVFKYKPVDGKYWETMSLDALEFMRRFLQHVLPKGFHKVRYYGILSPTNQDLLKGIKNFLQLKKPIPNHITITIPEAGVEPEPKPEPEPEQKKASDQPEPDSGWGDSIDKKKRICPKCKMGHMELVEQCEQFNPIMGRAPPC